MNKKKNNKTLYLVLGAVAVISALVITARNKNGKGIPVTLEPVTRKTIVETIPANGKIQPVTEVKISPDVSGEIVELNCKEGDPVRQGDLLIKIKQDVYLSAVDRAEASLNATRAQYMQQKASLAQIETNYRRNESLYRQKAISQSEYETALSQYEVAQEQLKAAEYNIKSADASLKEARENLIKTTIYAPMTGIVSKLSVEKGERVVGTSQMAGTEMLRIANLDEMEVLVDVNENDIIHIKQNDTAYIDVDAYPGRKFRGVVTQIANSAKSTGTISADQITNFEVKVSIQPDSYRDLLEKNPIPFRPGMSASVTIRTEVRENVLSIPLQAITTRTDLLDSLRSDGPVEQVFVYDPATSTVSPAVIRTGIQDMNDIEVLQGLADSARIVTGPFNAVSRQLKDGSLVTPQTK